MRGFTLIELLLALTVIAIVTLLSINRYQQYRNQIEVLLVKSDIAVIDQSLNNYFHLIGCDRDGIFPNDKINPSIADLGLSTTYYARKPLVTHYETQIIDTGSKTKNDKPIYLLQVRATLNTSLSPEQLSWYLNLFHAGKMDTSGHILTWQTLPGNSAANSDDSFWILDGARKMFRHLNDNHNCAAS